MIEKALTKSMFYCLLYPESLLSGTAVEVCSGSQLRCALSLLCMELQPRKEGPREVWSPQMDLEDILVLNTIADLLRIKSRVNVESQN